MFDEPSSYLDVKQRLKTARGIYNNWLTMTPMSLLLSMICLFWITCQTFCAACTGYQELTGLSQCHLESGKVRNEDFVFCLYGVPDADGVVTMPSGVREGKE